MHCPRCGTPNEPGDRFCSSCGAKLRRADREQSAKRSPRDRIRRLLGATRGEQLVSAGIALALAVAIASFFALDDDGGDDEIPRDAYTVTADRMCIDAKRRIAIAERRSLREPGVPDVGALAEDLLPILATWRADFRTLKVPSDRLEQAMQLDGSLRDVEIRIATLARVAGPDDGRRTVASAEGADEAAARVEEAASDLGLNRCARLALGFSPD